MNQIPIYFEKKFSGVFSLERKMFVMARDEAQHVFRKYNGCGLSKPIIMKLKELGCEVIKLELTTNRDVDTYLVGFDIFYSEGIGYDNGGDYQLILPFDKWTKLVKNTMRLERWTNG